MLLEAVIVHGPEILRASLGFPELCAFLRGLLCHPATATPSSPAAVALARFYAVLLPLTATGELVWSFLGAVLPSAGQAHMGMLSAQISELQTEMVSAACLESRDAFVAMLRQRMGDEAWGDAERQ